MNNNILLLIPTKDKPVIGDLYINEDGNYYHRYAYDDNKVTVLPGKSCYKVVVKIYFDNVSSVLDPDAEIIDDLHQAIIDKKMSHGDQLVIKKVISTDIPPR